MRFMKNASLRQLQIFESIARLGSFTAAANELFLTQPTVSMQIKKLAELIGSPLFETQGKRVLLTDAGRELLPVCRSIFRELEDYETVVEHINEIGRGSLSLSGVTTTEYFAPRILGDFIRLYPGITTSLEVTNRSNVVERIRHRVDDLYIIGQLSDDLDLELLGFLDNPMVVFAWPDHPLAGVPGITLTDIARENFIERELGCGTSLILERVLGSGAIRLSSTMRLGSNEAIKSAVKSRLGISMLSALALSREIESGEIAILDVEGFPYMDQWHLAYPRGARLSKVARAFLGFVEEHGAAYARELLHTP